MVELLIMADDFTGALDAGVQLAKKGIKTLVTFYTGLDAPVPEGVQVISVDLETRHMSPSKAYDRVSSAAAFAKEHGIERIYKKLIQLYGEISVLSYQHSLTHSMAGRLL